MTSKVTLLGLNAVRTAIADVSAAKSMYLEFGDTGLSELSSFQRFILDEDDSVTDIFDRFFEKSTKHSKYDTNRVEFVRSDTSGILEFNSQGPPYVKVKVFFVDDTYVKVAKWFKQTFSRKKQLTR